MNIRKRALTTGAAISVALLALTGCTSSASDESNAQQQQQAGGSQNTAAVTFEDTWMKAAHEGDMTAAFGLFENSSSEDITLVSVESSAAPMIELHETLVDNSGRMVMREAEGGLVIPANGKLLLEPGGNHIMLMGLPHALQAGESVTFTLTFSDGTTLEFTAIVKDYAGDNESYDSDDDGHGSMDHGDSEASQHPKN